MPAVQRRLLASPLAERYRLETISTWRPPGSGGRALVFAGSLVKLIAWCLGRGPRIVHIHTTVRGSLYRKAVCVLVARALRRPVIVHVHSGVGDIAAFAVRLDRVRLAFFRRVLGLADSVLSVSAAGAREFERSFGLSAIGVVPNAAPQISDAQLTSLRGDASKTADNVELLYLGGFANLAKGGQVLEQALPTILAQHPDARIALAGPGQPPPGLRALLDGSEGLRWLGWLEDRRKAELLSRCDVFLLPSISEGLPIALLEAMAYGLAIVATRVGGMPEVLTDGVDAVLVAPGSADELATATGSLIDDAPRRRALGGAARVRAERLSQKEVCDRLDRLYQALVAA